MRGSLAPGAGGVPTGDLQAKGVADSGSLDGDEMRFSGKCLKHSGSGWLWPVLGAAGYLAIVQTRELRNPTTVGLEPIPVTYVWERTFVVVYCNLLAKYVEAKRSQLINELHNVPRITKTNFLIQLYAACRRLQRWRGTCTRRRAACMWRSSTLTTGVSRT